MSSKLAIKTNKINSLMVKSTIIFPFIEYIFTYSNLSPWKINFPYVMIMLVFWLVNLSSKKIEYRHIMWIPFGVYIFVNKLYGYTSTYYLYIYSTAILSVFAVKRLNDDFIEYVIKATLITTFVFALGCILQKHFSGLYDTIANNFFNADGLELVKQYDSYEMYAGFQYQPTAAAAAIAIGIITMWSALKEKKTIKIIMLLVMYYALFLTAKRMFFILSVVVPILVYYLKVSGKAVGKLKGIIVVSIIAVIVVFLYNYFSSSSDLVIFKRLDEFSSGADMEDLSNGRFDLMDNAWEMFKENVIMGAGGGIFSRTYGTSVHNVYLQLLAEMGIIGFSLFVIPAAYMLFITIRLLRKKCKTQNDEITMKYSLGMQIMFLIYALSGNPLYNVQWIYVYFMACALALKVDEKRY